jgi:ribonuclease BN (tRNA processing enzyme)
VTAVTGSTPSRFPGDVASRAPVRGRARTAGPAGLICGGFFNARGATAAVRFTVLGTSGAWPERGRACSGYLVEAAGQRLVLDLGFGTLPRLLEQCRAEEVSAVFVSHAHPDHCVDLFGLYRARALPEPPFAPLPVYASPEVMDRVGGLGGPDGPARLKRECEFHPIGPDTTVDVGPFHLTTMALPHFVPNLGVRIEVDGLVVAYTGDTGPTARVADLTRDADLFVCEATHQRAPPDRPERFLLTATEAGRYARDGGATRLMLTHFWPGDDRSISRTEAAREFRGEILLADEGLSLSLP